MRILRSIGAVAACVMIMFIAACGADGDRPDPATVNFGFIGVTGSSIGSFTCASCHPGQVGEWAETRHASALSSLSQLWLGADYSADPTCLPCHVTGYDPFVINNGYDERIGIDQFMLANVQCESCHGPASLHNGDVTMIGSSWGAEVCANCHSNPFPTYNEWATSNHSQSLIPLNGLVAQLADCQKCHSAQGFVQHFIEQKPIDPALSTVGLAPISCAACHDPHKINANSGGFQLRITGRIRIQGETVTVGNGAVCILCHQTEGAPGEDPHESQSNLYLGIGGFEYPGKGPYPDGYHTTFQNACVSCHLSLKKEPWQGPGSAAQSGHDFRPTIDTCKVCHAGAVVWNIAAEMDYNCNTAIEGVQTEIGGLLTRLATLLGGPDPDPYDLDPNTLSDYDKAAYNYYIVANDGSGGIHNAPYAARLLQDSICSLDPVAAVCTDPTCRP